MTETTTETDETATETPDSPTEDTTTAEKPAESETGKEAAKYRRKLRETETERDTIAGRLEAMQRSEVARLAEQAKVKPEALYAAGTNLADLLADDGTVDTEKVTAAVQVARDTLGLPDPRNGNVVPKEGNVPRDYPRNGWADAFGPSKA